MSYVRIRYGSGYISKSLSLEDKSVDGYPRYIAYEEDDPNLIRTILYRNIDGSIYLTDRKKFKLVRLDDGSLVFSSNPDIEAYIPVTEIIPWSNMWKNMSNTDNMDDRSLVTPYTNWMDAVNLVSQRKYKVSIQIHGDKWYWIHGHTPCNIVRVCDNKYTYLVGRDDKSGSAEFTIDKKSDVGAYGLSYIVNGGFSHIPITTWNTHNASRLIAEHPSTGLNLQMVMNLRYNSNGLYEAYMGNGSKGINVGGEWMLGLPTLVPVHNGVEFYTRSSSKIVFTIVDTSITAEDMYRLGSFFRYDRSHIRDEDVQSNMPTTGSHICSYPEWDGKDPSCYGNSIPYTNDVGISQCKNLDSMNNDIHCQFWARSNKGTSMDTIMKNMCKDVIIDDVDVMPICSCYLSDDVYYDVILRESGDKVANGVKASKLLQCASGLCTGDGTVSSDIFYHDSRKCDICVQVMTTNINADKIIGDISLQQQCTHVDSTYTWNNLIDDLITYGAYVYPTGGIFKHVLINKGNTKIRLIPIDGIHAYDTLPTLSKIPIVSGTNAIKDIDVGMFNRSPSAISNEVLSFFLLQREE